MITSGGHPNPPVWQRVFWASAEGACAAVLLYAGGSEALSALQTAVVTIGLPFCLVLVAMCFSLLRALREEAEAGALDVGPSLALAVAGPEPGITAADPVGPQPSSADVEDVPCEVPSYSFSHILVPIDYSAHSLRAVVFAWQLADRLGDGTSVDLLHVTPRPVDYLPIDEWIWGESREPMHVESKLKEAANEALRAYTRTLPERMRCRVNVRLEIGVPYRVILDVVRDGKYDLLVIGTHGRNASRQVRLGSVAERIVRFAPTTVITVR
jgi:nucleotide-binding universal stress UspA family protein